jgi:YbgC/YbaW family acyl-CoA thioester hydrolase
LNMELPKILESKVKVRFHDCDPFNHLNNSRYIDYIVTARSDQLIENYSFDIYQMLQKQGIGWVSAQTQISYLHPAYLMEEITIQTRLIAFSEKSLQVEAQVWNDDKSVLKAVMWGKLVHFSLTSKKSQEHSPQLMQFFQGIVYPLEQQSDFESRVKALKTY